MAEIGHDLGADASLTQPRWPRAHHSLSNPCSWAPPKRWLPCGKGGQEGGPQPGPHGSGVWGGAGQTSRDGHLAGEMKALEKTARAGAAGGVALLQREDTAGFLCELHPEAAEAKVGGEHVWHELGRARRPGEEPGERRGLEMRVEWCVHPGLDGSQEDTQDSGRVLTTVTCYGSGRRREEAQAAGHTDTLRSPALSWDRRETPALLWGGSTVGTVCGPEWEVLVYIPPCCASRGKWLALSDLVLALRWGLQQCPFCRVAVRVKREGSRKSVASRWSTRLVDV